MSALFNFDAFCLVLLLMICTATYVKQLRKGMCVCVSSSFFV